MAVTKNISLDYQDVIVIGRRGENEAVDIVWDISPLIAEFGGGTALVLAKRATDESAYPVTLTEQTDTTLTWTVSSVDSCVIGVGKVQLFWYVGNVLAKSFMWRTFVGDDITGMVGDPPEAYESWLEHLAEMGADILNDAKDEVKNAEAWAVGERGGEPVVDGDETYHNNAKYWSGVSSDYAGNAESSADAAEQSAGDAAHQVELAEAQVTLAEGQVALAQQKVQDAAAQVSLATAQANAAAGSASDASGYALASSGYASDANTYKGQAYTSAQNAAQKASDAAGYALAASNSATDANTYKGQAQGFANAASGYADNASTYANNASGYADAASGYADAAAASATEAAGYVASLVNGKAGVLEDSASGDVVSIVPDKSVGKLYKAEVSLSPIQSGSGDPSPTNVRPISGHTGATLYRTGKNLAFPGAFVQGSINNATGQIISSGTRIASMLFPAESGKKYYIATDADKYVFEVFEFDANKTRIYVSAINAASGFITTRSNTVWVRYSVKYPNNAAITPSAQTKAIFTQSETAVELDSNGDTYPVTFGQTVYGGTFDFVSGKLVVDMASVTFDGSETWSTSGESAYTALHSLVKIKDATYIESIYCDKLVTVRNSFLMTDYSISGYNDFNEQYAGQNWIYIRLDGTQTSAQQFKDWLAANPIQVVYELATPIEIDLDPTEVETLIGTNNVWSDGEMSVDYAADLKTYIDNKIAAAVAALS